MLMHMHWTLAALGSNASHPFKKRPKVTRHHTSRLEEDTRWLLEAVLGSVTIIKALAIPSVQPFHLEAPSTRSFQPVEQLSEHGSEVGASEHSNFNDIPPAPIDAQNESEENEQEDDTRGSDNPPSPPSRVI